MADGEGTSTGNPAAPELTPAQLQFHLEEYRGLRAEINSNIRSQFEAYLYALVANGGIVAWSLANRSQLDSFGYWGLKLASLVPLLVTVLAYCWMLFYSMQNPQKIPINLIMPNIFLTRTFMLSSTFQDPK